MDRENFSRLIKRYRYERGISQVELAKLLGTGVTSIREWEQCKRDVTNESYMAVMRLLYPAKAKLPPNTRKK